VFKTQTIKPHGIKNEKPNNYKIDNDYRNYNKFIYFSYNNNVLTKDIFDLIEFAEVLKAFNGNKMDTSRLYDFSFFTAKIKSEDQKVTLSIMIKSFSNLYFKFDKLEAQILAAKISKVLSKLET
jgi:hypothetical protein